MPGNACVLVVDDDRDIRDLVHLVLADDGYEVVEAPNGAAALDAVAHCAPCAILLDVRMPVLDGPGFARAYRQLPGPHAPIICMTAEAAAPVRCRELHADDSLGKPFDLDQLAHVVREYCSGAQVARQGAAAEAPPA